jgi:hypothetical protein
VYENVAGCGCDPFSRPKVHREGDRKHSVSRCGGCAKVGCNAQRNRFACLLIVAGIGVRWGENRWASFESELSLNSAAAFFVLRYLRLHHADE